MIRTAPDAVIVCCNPLDARNVGSHPAERSQLAKSAIFPEKWPNSTLQADLGSQKEKKIDAGALDLSRFFRGTSFALEIIALTISSPETQRLSPSKGRATCSVGSPPRSPLVARPFFFSRKLRSQPVAGPHAAGGVLRSVRSTRSKFCLAFMLCNFCYTLGHWTASLPGMIFGALTVHPGVISLAWGNKFAHRWSHYSGPRSSLVSADAGWQRLSSRLSPLTSAATLSSWLRELAQRRTGRPLARSRKKTSVRLQ